MPVHLSPVLVRFFFLFLVPLPPLMIPDRTHTPERHLRTLDSIPGCSHYFLPVKCRYFSPPCTALQKPRITVHDKVVKLPAYSVLVPNPIRFAYPVAASLPQIPRQESMSWHRISSNSTPSIATRTVMKIQPACCGTPRESLTMYSRSPQQDERNPSHSPLHSTSQRFAAQPRIDWTIPAILRSAGFIVLECIQLNLNFPCNRRSVG
ncbi:hypothetical protein B0H14DRAFT_2591286 [Mycena olivaceomarginata]|nr:hypothetical protein B0H14DRAFT_2591286 [Mycena olivaceomarginata]